MGRMITAKEPRRLYCQSVQGESKMVIFRDPERSGLFGREHRKRKKRPFTAHYGPNISTP
jgi:hypothetical protein